MYKTAKKHIKLHTIPHEITNENQCWQMQLSEQGIQEWKSYNIFWRNFSNITEYHPPNPWKQHVALRSIMNAKSNVNASHTELFANNCKKIEYTCIILYISRQNNVWKNYITFIADCIFSKGDINVCSRSALILSSNNYVCLWPGRLLSNWGGSLGKGGGTNSAKKCHRHKLFCCFSLGHLGKIWPEIFWQFLAATFVHLLRSSTMLIAFIHVRQLCPTILCDFMH